MQPPERLDEALKLRRLDLRMSWREVARTVGISPTALRAIRRGEYRPSELTARAMDDFLHWAHGSVDAVLDGNAPQPAVEVAPQPESEDPVQLAIEALLERYSPEEVADILHRVVTGFPPDRQDEIRRRLAGTPPIRDRDRRDVG